MRLAIAPAIIMAVSLMMFGCAGDYREPYYTNDKEPIGTGDFANGIRNGVWTQQAGNGQVVWRGTYVNGLRQGSWKEWNANGAAMVEANYDQNRLHGQARIFGWGTMAGKLERVESYDHGHRDGEWRYFDTRKSTIIKIEHYAQDMKQGSELTISSSGYLHEVVFDKNVPVMDRIQQGNELNIYQLGVQRSKHGIWVTVVGDVITRVVHMEHGQVTDNLFTYTPPGTPPEKHAPQTEGGWRWTTYVSQNIKYSAGFKPAKNEIQISQYESRPNDIWAETQRWVIKEGKALQHERKDLGPNREKLVWLPADLTVVPPDAAYETIVVNPPSKVLRGISLPLDLIQVPQP